MALRRRRATSPVLGDVGCPDWDIRASVTEGSPNDTGNPHFAVVFYTDNPHIIRLQTVVQTPTFLADAKAAGVTEDELSTIVATVAADPEAGDLIVGTGGARKLRIGGKGRGKSGGYRVITYFAVVDVQVFLLALVSKGQRADIS